IAGDYELGGRIDFRVRLEEQFQFRFFWKDDDPKNESPANRGIHVEKTTADTSGVVQVAVRFTLPDGQGRTVHMGLPIEFVESCAEEYLSGLTHSKDAVPQKLFSYSVDESV